VLNQAAGVGLAWGISIVGTLVLLFVVDKLIGLRVSPEQEAEGLDITQHGEKATTSTHNELICHAGSSGTNERFVSGHDFSRA